MSAAAGASPPPPPPPPPPRRASAFDDLPAELLLEIYEKLSLTSFMNLVLAIYPTLERHRLVPALALENIDRLEADRQRAYASSVSRSAVFRVPRELWLQVGGYLDSFGLVSLVLALGGVFYRLDHEPSEEEMQRLRMWARRSEKRE